MKKNVIWGISAVIIFVIFMLAKLPASQVLGRVSVGPNIGFYQVEGTLWQGAMARLSINGLPVEDVSWSINPFALLLGQVSLEVRGGNIRDPELISVRGPVRFSLFNVNRVQTEGLQLYLPADRALAKVALPIPVQAGGRFKVSVSELDFGPQCHTLTGNGEWLNAWVGGTQGPIDLGNFSAALQCENNQLRIQVSEPNSLGLSLVSTISPDFQSFSVEGKFKPSDTLPNEVHQAGKFFGSPDAQGYTAFKL
ncbi:type II secretion system protein N [Alteromonas sediminis]|uniref:Type II secretion system protein N n=1 Tax=Alteromonas sediminis TaxID=2259342 RepID=A0A3N5XZG5_9ALTE|nr:type II secretion system protein N [Alteromonas sediminis]RPJ66687.1 type II secretion system protein N [Alteromonas sediminis]